MGKIISRIRDIAVNENITLTALERAIGASKGVLSRALANGTDIQSKWIEAVVENYPQYSTRWLLTGDGEMMRQTHRPNAIKAPEKLISTYKSSEKHVGGFIESSKKISGAIPLVSETAVGGFSSEHFSIQENDVLAYYIIPKFRHLGIDFMIELVGDSMIPRFFPGDIIACSIIHNINFIQWNKPHLIATRDQGLIVKRLRKSADRDCLLAVSDNAEYDPFDIPKEDILGLARVVGVIHLE